MLLSLSDKGQTLYVDVYRKILPVQRELIKNARLSDVELENVISVMNKLHHAFFRGGIRMTQNTDIKQPIFTLQLISQSIFRLFMYVSFISNYCRL